MPGCGYICPKCNDTGFDDKMNPCDWCSDAKSQNKKTDIISDEDWQKAVHEGPCCGDLGQKVD